MRVFFLPLCNSLHTFLSSFSLLLLSYIRSQWTPPLTRDKKGPTSISFLHPHPLSGGGGERVLWCLISTFHSLYPNARINLHAAWTASAIAPIDAVDICKRKVYAQFGIDVNAVDFHAVDLPCADWVDAHRYPRFTLLLQGLGAVRLGYEVMKQNKYVDLMVDSANLSFGCVIPKMFGVRTVSYVHYPTISKGMGKKVRERRIGINNKGWVAASGFLSRAKGWYYWGFEGIYGMVGGYVDVVMVNSKWTGRGIGEVWGGRRDLEVVYPPCGSGEMEGMEEVGTQERVEGIIVSVGQFREEKKHWMQIQVVEELVRRGVNVKLVMIGGARNETDKRRSEDLKRMSEIKKLPVEVMVGAKVEEMREWMKKGVVGIHTMEEEHFGISVVELMRWGLVVVGHRSGGVESDIVEDGVNGFLAGGLEEYVEKVERVLKMEKGERERIRRRGMAVGCRFTDELFEERVRKIMAK